jgi:transposase-like protein
MDLRIRIVNDAVGSLGIAATAKQYGVGETTVRRYIKRHSEDNLAPTIVNRSGSKNGNSKCDEDYETGIIDLIHEENDLYD